MTTRNTGVGNGEPTALFRWFHRRESLISIVLVLFAVAFNLYYLYPEVAGDVPDWDDNVFHLLMTKMAVEAIIQGRDFTDPWQGTMGMGYPMFHYYHHPPHIILALVHVLTLGVFALADMLNWTTYLLLSLFPLSIYWSLRRFGFDQISSAMGGLVASLATTNGLFGLGFASYVFQGLGLYSQLWAMVLLPPALALGYRVVREGRGYFWATLLLAATLMSHLIYGYIAFLTLGVLTFIQPMRLTDPKPLVETMWRRWKRLIILLLLVVVVTSYFLIPLFLDLNYSNRSVWDDPIRFNSYGHIAVLSGLVNGHLFDFERFPSLTIFVFAGLVICLLRWREERYLIPVAIFLLWLLLYFGRSTWGPLIDLLPMSRYLQMHRFIAGVHLGGIILMAVALAAPWRWAVSRASMWYSAAALALTLLVLVPVYSERRSYLEQNALWIKESRQGLGVEAQDLSALLDRIEQLPFGRIYAGHQYSGLEHWSDKYYVGLIHVYDLLHTAGLYPAASSWLASGLPVVKQHPVVSIGSPSQELERTMLLSEAVDVIPGVKASSGPSRGTVHSEDVGSYYFAADVTVERESMLLLKATYHPNWRATVDGVKTDTVMLMPSFVGVQWSPGDHKVRIEYRSRPLRLILLGLGLLTLPLIAMGEKRSTTLSSRFATGFFARISGSVRRPRSTRRRQSRRRR